jgi:hypothetical protein
MRNFFWVAILQIAMTRGFLAGVLNLRLGRECSPVIFSLPSRTWLQFNPSTFSISGGAPEWPANKNDRLILTAPFRVYGHPGVIRLEDWYECMDSFILVMERPESAVDLFDYIRESGRMGEAEAQDVFKQVQNQIKSED